MIDKDYKTNQYLAEWAIEAIQNYCPVVEDRLVAREEWGSEDSIPKITIKMFGKESAVHISYKTVKAQEKRYNRTITFAEIKDIIDEILKSHEWISQANYTPYQNYKYMDGELEWSFGINWKQENLKGINCRKIVLNIQFKDNPDLQKYIISSLYEEYFEKIKDKAEIKPLAELLGNENLLIKSLETGEKLESLEDTITVWDYFCALNPELNEKIENGKMNVSYGIFERDPFQGKINYSKLSLKQCKPKYTVTSENICITMSLDEAEKIIVTRNIPMSDKLSLYCGNQPLKEFLEEIIENFNEKQKIKQKIEQTRLRYPDIFWPTLENYTTRIEAFQQLLDRINVKQANSGKILSKEKHQQNN